MAENNPAFVKNMALVGWRKAALAVLVIVLSTILLWFGKIGGSEWVTAVSIAIGLFMGGNVASKYIFYRDSERYGGRNEYSEMDRP